MRRRSLAPLVALSLSALVALLPAAPASASGGALVSLDGLTFSQAPTGSLFDPNYRAIPGDRLNGSLWVRNDSTTNARMTFAVTDVSGSAELLRALRLEHTPNEWLPILPSNGHCGEMTIGRALPAGSTTRVDLSLVVDSSLTQGRTDVGRFALRTLLTDATAPAPAAAACESGTVVSAFDDETGIDLPTMATTGIAPLLSVSLAGGAIVLGGLLAVRPRRQKEHA